MRQLMSRHECLEHLLVLHSAGSDTPHKLVGVGCACLPVVCCAVCDRNFFKYGEAEARDHWDSVASATHIYPAWQEQLRETT